MQHVFIIRHALRADTEDPSWRATAARPDDPPLSAKGLEQARSVGAYLQSREIIALYCSPFLRAIQTAQKIHEETGIPFRVDEALSEWLRPTWFQAKPQFLGPEELQAQFSGYDPSYRSSTVAAYPEPDVEIQVYARVKQFLERLTQEENGSVALVGHGASVSQAIRALCGEEPSGIVEASVTEIELIDGQWKSKGILTPAQPACETSHG